MRFYKWILIIGLTLLLFGCDNQQPKTPEKYIPKVNPKPKYFFTVKGYIDPKIAKHLKLDFVADYYTYNLTCNVMINRFEGVDEQRRQQNQYNITPNKAGYYKLKIPLDGYLPGFCKWRILSISYEFNYHKQKQIAYSATSFDLQPNTKKHKANFYQSWGCDTSTCKFTKYYMDGKSLNIHGNYVFILNFNKGSK